jgi:hypothetical protein
LLAFFLCGRASGGEAEGEKERRSGYEGRSRWGQIANSKTLHVGTPYEVG